MATRYDASVRYDRFGRNVELDPAQTYLLTIPQVAKMLNLPESSAYQLAQHNKAPFGPGGIEVLTLGDKVKRCRMADVARYVSGNSGVAVGVLVESLASK